MYNSKQRGFTLIEMLIVLLIVGLLATLVAVALGRVGLRSRDTRRKADLRTIKTAIIMRSSLRFLGTPPGDDGLTTYFSTGGPQWIPDLAEELPAKVPQDPTNNATFRYEYRRSGNDYEIRVRMESGNDPDACNDGGDDGCAFYEKGTNLVIL